MGFERLAGRVQGKACELNSKCKGKAPKGFSRTGSECELHFKSSLWNLCGEQLEGRQAAAGIQACGSGGWARTEGLEKQIDRRNPRWWSHHASVIWGLCGFRKAGQSRLPGYPLRPRARVEPVAKIGDRGQTGWGLEWWRIPFGLLWIGPISLSSGDVK